MQSPKAQKDSQYFILTLTFLILVTVLLVVGKIESEPIRKPFSPNVFMRDENPEAQEGVNQQVATNEDGNEFLQFQPDGQETPGGSVSEGAEADQNSHLTFEIFQKIEIPSFVLKRRPFEGKFFGEVEVLELQSVRVVHQVVESLNGGGLLAEAWEFHTGSSDLNEEVYSLLKGKFQGQIGSEANETNQFGLKSFYVNFSGETENVFLVVKMPKAVYALSYLKTLHQHVKQVFQYL